MNNKLTYLIFHCLATPENREVSKEDLERMHKSPPPIGRGWKQFGYRAFIHLDGTIEHLVDNNDDDIVDPWEITNGVLGKNSISQHIAYVGGVDANLKPKDTRTPAQLSAMEDFAKDFVIRHPHILIAGHYDFANKACPSFDVVQWCREIGIPESNIYKK